MIMDDDYDMCNYSACNHTDGKFGLRFCELWSMTVLCAVPLSLRSVH